MNQKRHTPEEAAKKLGISVRMLGYLRREGRIEGTPFGNTTAYTDEQLANADLSKRKPGPKSSPQDKNTLYAIA
jgi:hypothetical protein